MGQDSESAAEFVMTVRTEHVVMKTWYNDSHDNIVINKLKEKYGDYPALWKEALNWPGWKETRKEYLKFQQTNATTNNGHNGQLNDHSEQSQSSATAPARKRKSRWGTASSGGDNTNNDSNDPDGRRQSRWGRDDQQLRQQQQSLPSETMMAPSNTTMMPQFLLPGIMQGSNGMMNVQLTPQQSQEMEVLRGRLRFVNDKLEKVDSEAERIDALPRSNPERSPSPPPSKYTRNVLTIA